jgi:hypothetical protein
MYIIMKTKTIDVDMEYWCAVAKAKGNNNDILDWVDAESRKAKEEGYDTLVVNYAELNFNIFERSVQNDLEIGRHQQ